MRSSLLQRIALLTLALVLALWTGPALYASANAFVNGFLREADGSLDVAIVQAAPAATPTMNNGFARYPDGSLAVTCTTGCPTAPPAPTPIPCPTASTGITITGTTMPACSFAATSSAPAYDAAILAETSLVHYWPMNDALGATAAVDAKGASNLTAVGNVSFGSRSITRDGESSCLFDNVLGDYLTFPAATIPAGAFTLEMVLRSPVSGNVFFSADANKNFDLFTDTLTNGFHILTGAGTQTNIVYNSTLTTSITYPVLIDVVYNGAASTTIYLDGSAFTAAITPSQSGAGRVGSWASAAAASTNAFAGNIAKLAIYNAALTRAKVLAHLALL